MDFNELEKQLGLGSGENEEDIDKVNQELDELMDLLDNDDEEFIDVEQIFTSSKDEVIEELLKEDESMELEEIDTDIMNDISTYDNSSEEVPDELIDMLANKENEENQDNSSEENQDNSLEENQDNSLEENQNNSLEENQDNSLEENQDNSSEENQDNSLEENQDNSLEENQDNSSEESQDNSLEENQDNSSEENQNNSSEDINLENLEEETKNTSNKSKSTVIIYSIIGFLIALIILSSVFFVIAINKIKLNNLEKEIEREKEQIQSFYSSSEVNTYYLGLAEIIDDIPVTLEKVSIDPFYIKFYINSAINPMSYDIRLTDRNKNLYAMETNFINQEDNLLEIRFSYVQNVSTDYSLKFISLQSDQEIEFLFNISNINNFVEIRYLNSIIENAQEGYNINITGGTFSPTGTRIYYTFESDEEASYTIQQGILGNGGTIRLYEEDKELSSFGNKPFSQEVEDGLILGRADFENVSNYNSNLVITFDDLYKRYTINETITLAELNQSYQSGGISFNFDKYKLVMESMPQFDDLFVLVFHGEDTTISTENRASDYNRIEVLLDADVILETSSGMEVILEASEIISDVYGTDMLFKLDEIQKSFLNGVSDNNIKIKINSFLIKINSVNIPINLSRAMKNQLLEDEIMLEEIENAFISRLENKYNISKGITGFSADVLNDASLIQEYETVYNAENAKFSINLITKKLDNHQLDAILQEVVKYEIDGEEFVSYKMHIIQAKYSDGKWIIINDKIIK